MTSLKLTEFMGAIPARSARSLPDGAASACLDIDLVAGGIRSVPGSSFLANVNPSTKKVYRIPTGAADNLAASYWWEFSDANTDIVRTPIVNDSLERFYWCSPTSVGLQVKKKTDILATGTAGANTVGVQAPADPMTVTPSGGSADSPMVTRAYVCTFVNQWGEESAPSPAAEATGHIDDNWALTALPPVVPVPFYVPITQRRIYRTVTANSGVTDFYLVAEISIGDISYNDTLNDSDLIQVLESTLWVPPPIDLQGIALMPNGIIVGWSGNTLYFCENFRPHAWPVEYALTTEFPVVGLGVVGPLLVVLTTGKPAIVSGVKSSTMSLTTHALPLPCKSRLSIIATPDGVLYASEPGIVQVSPNGIAVLTQELFGRDAWRVDYGAGTMQMVLIEGTLCAFHVHPTSGHQLGFMFYPGAPQAGVTGLTVPADGSSWIMVDPWSGKPLIIADGKLYEWLKPGTAGGAWSWTSKEYQLPKPVNLSCFQAFWDQPGHNDPLTVEVTADGVLRYSEELTAVIAVGASGRVFRLPGGFKASLWQVRLSSEQQLHSFAIAQTVTELEAL